MMVVRSCGIGVQRRPLPSYHGQIKDIGHQIVTCFVSGLRLLFTLGAQSCDLCVWGNEECDVGDYL